MLTRLADLVETYLLGWVCLAVGVGLAVPGVAVLTRASTLLLAVMVGSVSLTLSVSEFRQVRLRALAPLLAGHAAMPFLAVALARALSLSPPATVGFVVLGAVTPELVTPVVTELAGGDTALSTTALVVVGVGSLGFVPAVVSALGGVGVDPTPIVAQLLVAVVAPMACAVGLRARYPRRVARYDDLYPSVGAVMVVLVVGGVTAANADLLRAGGAVLGRVALAAVALNGLGYALGWTLGARATPAERTATTLSVGMRDFAVAAALVVAAGLPTAASLPAVVFGVVELSSSAALAALFGR